MSRSIVSHCAGGVIILVNRHGNVALDRIGELDTKNEAEVVTNDASPCHMGVYGGGSFLLPPVLIVATQFPLSQFPGIFAFVLCDGRSSQQFCI